ncbi:hypothetical protein K432DRAFT_236467 [Lepidopterella palustris CBS 459.81]|uniref:Uncharacterized protein n=1 Tax=Lepidopterella palustris CBS 459.81 TaxID=1314670 RepID=A0A8E2DXB4_9PEZI|nr:hypothetical protein K432DRAFT_236467 [Lepidopterella palustris CBS 459.81]
MARRVARSVPAAQVDRLRASMPATHLRLVPPQMVQRRGHDALRFLLIVVFIIHLS